MRAGLGSAADAPKLDVSRARQYRRARLSIMVGSLLWGVFVDLHWMRKQRARRLYSAAETVAPRRMSTLAFFFVVTLIGWLAALPMATLRGWQVERHFGLTKQPLTGFFAESVKSLAITLVVQPLALTGAWMVIRRWPRGWWLILSGLVVPISVFFGMLAPVLLAPIFNRFSPLQDEDLVRRIRALSEKSGTTISGVMISDMSRQSEKPNAYFTGIGPTKRIVLSDTLIRDFSPEEIESVVAHELGHQVHGDIWRLVGLSGVLGFAGAWVLSRIAPVVVRRTSSMSGVMSVSEPAAFPAFALVLTAVGFVLGPVGAAVSRSIERRTDAYAISLTGNGSALASALERLASAALEDPAPPRWYVVLFGSHPPIGERIAAAEKLSAESW